MKTIATLLLAFLFIGASSSSTSIGSVSAEITESVAADLEGSQAAPGSNKSKQTAPAPFEPLLLLLLGLTLFSIGTAIKMVLARQFNNNLVRSTASVNTTASPRLLPIEPFQGGD